jgi:hypothetical protein
MGGAHNSFPWNPLTIGERHHSRNLQLAMSGG